MATHTLSVLRWSRIGRPGDSFHFAEAEIHGVNPGGFHGHDFGEVFWIDSGRGFHELAGGRKPLDAGDLVFVRPRDRHALRSRGDAPMRLINVAFPRPVLDQLRARYFAQWFEAFWARTVEPTQWPVDFATREWLDEWRRRLTFGRRNRFEIDLFLMELLHRFLAREVEKGPAVPAWLGTALLRAREPEVFRAGAAGMIRAAGRSGEHVAREMRRLLGCSPTEYVNRVRLDYAARLLETSSRPIIEVAWEAGFASQAYFTRLFARTHGLAPLQYRNRHLRVAV